MTTILLNPSSWDLLVDASGNIAVASDPYSLAQDAASAIKTFQSECYYDTTIGVPYWSQILGLSPPLSLMKQKFVDAAMTVPGVVAAVCYIASFINRKVSGQVQITSEVGVVQAVNF